MDVDGALDRLRAVPLEDFVAERKRLAKALRDAGHRDTAAQVAKAPKPTPPAWALNHVAREDPAAVGAWLEAAAELRDASARPAEAGGDALRAAMAAHRTATTRLVGVVAARARPGGKPLTDAMLDRVRAVLQAATADAGIAEALRTARVDEDLRPGALPAAAPGPPPVRDEQAERAAAARRAREELERRAAAAASAVARAQDEAERRAAAAQEAQERLDDARRTVLRRESEAGAARAAADDAEAELAVARDELQRLEARLRAS